MTCVCGVIHSNEVCDPLDPRGCILPVGHSGPHEFVSTNGQRYQWEPDLECQDCPADECECTVYWPVTQRG